MPDNLLNVVLGKLGWNWRNLVRNRIGSSDSNCRVISGFDNDGYRMVECL